MSESEEKCKYGAYHVPVKLEDVTGEFVIFLCQNCAKELSEDEWRGCYENDEE